MKLKIKTRYKKSFIIFLLVAFNLSSFGLVVPTSVEATTHVKGYLKKSGKYVAPHYRTDKNKIKIDNWSTKGNVNLYTGKKGTKKLQ